MDIQLGTTNSKSEKVRRITAGYMSSTHLSEHRVYQCCQHRHRTASREVGYNGTASQESVTGWA
jgi:hypothetical protein